MILDTETLRVGYVIFVGGWALTLAGYAYCRIADIQNDRIRRQAAAVLLAFVVAVFLRVTTLYANNGQPVADPCHSCQSADGLLWWLLGCWSC